MDAFPEILWYRAKTYESPTIFFVMTIWYRCNANIPRPVHAPRNGIRCRHSATTWDFFKATKGENIPTFERYEFLRHFLFFFSKTILGKFISRIRMLLNSTVFERFVESKWPPIHSYRVRSHSWRCRCQHSGHFVVIIEGDTEAHRLHEDLWMPYSQWLGGNPDPCVRWGYEESTRAIWKSFEVLGLLAEMLLYKL